MTQRRTVVAIQLALEDEDRLLHVTKDIYCAAAEIFGCKWTTVERSIRLVVKRVWSDNAEGLIQMAGYPLSEAPTASDFVEILSLTTSVNMVQLRFRVLRNLPYKNCYRFPIES